MGMSVPPGDDRFTHLWSGSDLDLQGFVPTPEQRARQAEGMTNLRRAWAAMPGSTPAPSPAPCAYCRGTSRTPKGRCESCGAMEVRP